MDKEEGISILMQIIMTLLCYQKTLQFTHNDLHTNNIMFIKTDQEFLYYVYKRNTYKVPTFGKIYKIIDFGRAIYNYNGERFCSDSFAPSGDASTQYNCEPYMDNDKPRLDPNYSFDLCRLGCALYDFVIDDNVPIKDYDEFQQIVYNWCLDDNNKNILYKKNGEERYPNFKLYKMIARTVHNKTPDDQLNYKVFKQYIIEPNTEIPTEMCINVDLLPEYYTKYM
jgi:serine/threonine protein kinase